MHITRFDLLDATNHSNGAGWQESVPTGREHRLTLVWPKRAVQDRDTQLDYIARSTHGLQPRVPRPNRRKFKSPQFCSASQYLLTVLAQRAVWRVGRDSDGIRPTLVWAKMINT